MRAFHFIPSALVLGLTLTGCGTRRETPPAPVLPVVTPEKSVLPEIKTHQKIEKSQKVGVLLPLSGPQGALGRELLNGAQMAFFDGEKSDSELIIQDSMGTVEGAHQGARTLLDKDVSMIVGPLLSAEVAAVRPLVYAKNKPMVALTSDTKVVGEGTYTLGFPPEQQAQSVIRYAKAQGIPSVVALLPQGAYGDVMAGALENLKGEILIKKVMFYADPSGVSVSDLGLENGDGIFVPEGGDRLLQLTTSLKNQGLDPALYQWLGSAQWDQPATFSNSDIGRGWYASPVNTEWHSFAQRYEKLYGTSPSRLASMAYDGVAMALAVSGNGQNTRDLLLNRDGFIGIDGQFSFAPSGIPTRQLTVYEVTPQGVTVRSNS